VAVSLASKMRMDNDPSCTTAVVRGYEDMVAAAHDAPLLKHFPAAACEGLDSRMLARVIDTKGAEATPSLPEGAGWLVVEPTGEDEPELERETQRDRKSVVEGKGRAEGGRVGMRGT